MDNSNELSNLGWQTFFQQQLTLDEWDVATPARIVEQHRSEITLATGERVLKLSLLASMPDMVVGDWLLLNRDDKLIRLLNN